MNNLNQEEQVFTLGGKVERLAAYLIDSLIAFLSMIPLGSQFFTAVNDFSAGSIDSINSLTIENTNNMLLPPINFGSWKVENFNNKSKLIYRLCTNPGGKIPIWIVKQANQRYFPQMLLDLESHAMNKK